MSFAFDALFDAHVLEFAGFEDLAAFQTLNEFGIFVAADDLHARVLAGLIAHVFRLGQRLCGHKSGNVALLNKGMLINFKFALISVGNERSGDESLNSDQKHRQLLNHSIVISYHSTRVRAVEWKDLRGIRVWK